MRSWRRLKRPPLTEGRRRLVQLLLACAATEAAYGALTAERGGEPPEFGKIRAEKLQLTETEAATKEDGKKREPDHTAYGIRVRIGEGDVTLYRIDERREEAGPVDDIR